jgi:hypothetical protein
VTIREREDQIRCLPVETAVAWNAEGQEVLTKSGDERRIIFTDEEIVLLQGTVLTHNHPGGLAFSDDDPRSFGNSFSVADIRLACDTALTEMRAVTPKLRFSLKPSSAGWDSEYWQQVLEPIYFKHKLGVTRELLSAIQAGKMPEPIAESLHFHEICLRVAAEAGLHYHREEN